MARIVITEFMDQAAVDMLRAVHNVHYDPNLVDASAELMRQVADADAVIVRNRTQVRGALLDGMTRCKVIGRLGVGLDNIDVNACQVRDIQVIPATGANALSVAEYVIATAFLLLRGAYAHTGSVAAGQWPRNALSAGREMHGKTLGLIGFGMIGQLTGSLARALGMQVCGYDPLMTPTNSVWHQQQTKPVQLSELLSTSDVVSLHIPLLDSTRDLINVERLALMKTDAILINTARGNIVDEIAVAAALKARRLGGAALDVFTQEPLPLQAHFADCPNLILTPHIAGVTFEGNQRVSNLIAQQVLQALVP